MINTPLTTSIQNVLLSAPERNADETEIVPDQNSCHNQSDSTTGRYAGPSSVSSGQLEGSAPFKSNSAQSSRRRTLDVEDEAEAENKNDVDVETFDDQMPKHVLKWGFFRLRPDEDDEPQYVSLFKLKSY